MSILSTTFKFLATISLLVSTSAQANNLLVNGDFEAQSLGLYDHPYVHVTGWNVARISGSSVNFPKGNLVGVSGSGWGNPSNDASGVGTEQHYLDGMMTAHAWQQFTAPCTGAARSSIAFSLRGGNSATAQVSVAQHNGSAINLPLVPLSTNFSNGSANMPSVASMVAQQNFVPAYFTPSTATNSWTVFNNSHQLQGGETYTFMVMLPQNANFDNASVEMENACPLPAPELNPERTSIQKTCQAPVAGVHNGATGQFWSCQINVNATPAPFSGTLTVTDNPIQNSNWTSGSVVSMTSVSGNFDCSAPDSCTIDGANFTNGTETIDVQTFVRTTSGNAASYTATNCVAGTYQNDGATTELNGNCVSASFTPSANAKKTCEPIQAVASGPMTLNCQITATGNNLPTGSHIVVGDLFGGMPPSTASVVGPMMNVASNENWSCADGQQNSPGSIGLCSLPATDLAAAGGSSTLNVSFQFELDTNPPAGEKRPQVVNCPYNDISMNSAESILNGGKSRNGKPLSVPKSGKVEGLPDGCVFLDVPPYKGDTETTYDIKKICKANGKRHVLSPSMWFQPYQCEITVTTNGVPFTNPIYVNDALNMGGNNASQQITGLSSADPWTCNAPPYSPQVAAGCWIMGTQFPHSTGSSTIVVDMVLNSSSANQGTDNCASLNSIDPKTGKPTPIGESCTTVFEKPEPHLEVTKVCAQPVNNGSVWDVTCQITLSGSNLTPGHQIRLSDEMSTVTGYAASTGTLQSSTAQCSGFVTANGAYSGCDLSTDDLIANNGSITFPYTGTFTQTALLARPKTAQNCVFADMPSLNLHAPNGGNDKICVPLQLGKFLEVDDEVIGNPPVKPKRNLSIEKKQIGSCVAGSACNFLFTITNTGTVAMGYPQLVDTISPASNVTAQSMAADWSCAVSNGRIICNPLAPNTLAPGATRNIDIQITLPASADGEYRNCVGIQWLPYEISYRDRSVRSVQQVLTNKGYKPGPIDGAMGSLTREAIRQFESRNGLPATGEINERFATLLFGTVKPFKFGDDNKEDDNSCVGVEYDPSEPQHSKKKSRDATHNTYRSLLVPFHRQYRSSLHDGKATRLIHNREKSQLDDHDTRVSRIHNTYKSEQHNARTTRVIVEHSRARSRLRDFHKKYRSSQHDRKVTRLGHDRRKSRDEQHDKRLSRFHRRFKSEQHNARTTRVIREHSKSQSALRDFHKKYKSNQHDGERTRLRHDRRKSRMDVFHRRYKSEQHNARTTRVIRTHSKSQSALRDFHKKYKSNQHDGKRTRLRHDRRKSRIEEIHRKFKSEQHDSKTTRIRANKPRPRPAEGQVKK